MKKRKKRVIRVHKLNSTTQPHEYRFSQLQLYHPFEKEEDLGPDNFEKCDQLYNECSQHNGEKRFKMLNPF